MAGYIPKWFTHLQITHASTNPTQSVNLFFYLFKHFVVYSTQEISIHTKRNKKDILQVIKSGI